MNSKELYLLKEVFQKVKFNELTGKYTINKEDYIFLNLDEETMQTLENMCKEYKIYLEKFPDSLSTKEANKLFIRYNYLKNIIKENQSDTNITSIEEEIIQIKQTIALGYMEFMYKFISSRFPNLIKERDKEDIYQTGYELLIHFIDLYDINKGTSFSKYISRIVSNNIPEKIWKEKRNININQARDLVAILPNIDKPSEEETSKFDIEEIKQKTGICKDRIKHLISVIEATTETSIEENQEHYLHQENFEEELLNQFERENIKILIETLPEAQKQVIKLYYGFINGKRYNYGEIAKILGYNTEERVRQIQEKALITLSIPAYRNAISSFSENTKIINERLRQASKIYIEKRQSELEDKIISALPKEQLIKLIEDFPSKYQNVLALYYGLKTGINYNGINYSIEDICIILNKREIVVKEMIKEAIKKVAKKINKNPNKPYINYLVENYLETQTKRR